MPSLTIRDIPRDVMDRLRQAAREERRSINAQAIRWFEEAAGQRASKAEVRKLLRDIEASRAKTYRRHGLGSDSTKLIRRTRGQRGEVSR